MNSSRRRVVVAMTGASGIIYALDLLTALRELSLEAHLVVTAGAKRVLPTEVDDGLAKVESLAAVVHKNSDIGAAVASGSFPVRGMVVVPCSAGTLAKVANGMADNLVTRAAHVMLKERRPLVMVVREAPYSRPMMQNMVSAHDAGATILPASPGFYHRPESISDLVGGITSRTLDLLGIENDWSPRWRDAPGTLGPSGPSC